MARSRLLLGIIVAVAATAAACGAAADPLKSVVDRYVAWRGGQAFRALTSVHETGAIEQGGLKGSFETWATNGRWRDEVRLAGMNVVEVTTTAASWTSSLSGQPLDAPNAYETARRLWAIEYGDALLGGGATASLAGTRASDGRVWDVVEVRFGDACVYQALIDPTTGALDGFTVRERGQLREERFSDWRMIDGVRMAFTETDSSDADGTVVSRVQTMALNDPLAPSLFAAPPTARRSSFADGAASTGWIAFDLFAGRQICLPVKVNGRETTALLDNGASVSILDSDFATSIGLQPRGAFATPGAGGVGVTGRVAGVTVQVGNLTLSDLTVGATNMDGFGRAIGRPVPLILGDEPFNELVVDIDFANRRLAFIDPKAFTPPAGALKLLLSQVQDARLVPITVEGGPPAMFALDIGDDSTVDVSPGYAHDRGLLAGRLTARRSGVGIGGSFANIVTTLHTVDFAGVHFSELPAAFPQTWPAATHPDAVQGRLGIGLLSRFHVVIDWAHDALYLTPNSEAAAPFAKDRLGLSVARRGRDAAVVVIAVEPHSPAAAAGLRVGDHIMTINGRPADDVILSGKGRPGEQLVLVTRDSDSAAAAPVTRTVTLADYY